jgi:hypothetical protein
MTQVNDWKWNESILEGVMAKLRDWQILRGLFSLPARSSKQKPGQRA